MPPGGAQGQKPAKKKDADKYPTPPSLSELPVIEKRDAYRKSTYRTHYPTGLEVYAESASHRTKNGDLRFDGAKEAGQREFFPEARMRSGNGILIVEVNAHGGEDPERKGSYSLETAIVQDNGDRITAQTEFLEMRRPKDWPKVQNPENYKDLAERNYAVFSNYVTESAKEIAKQNNGNVQVVFITNVCNVSGNEKKGFSPEFFAELNQHRDPQGRSTTFAITANEPSLYGYSNATSYPAESEEKASSGAKLSEVENAPNIYFFDGKNYRDGGTFLFGGASSDPGLEKTAYAAVEQFELQKQLGPSFYYRSMSNLFEASKLDVHSAGNAVQTRPKIAEAFSEYCLAQEAKRPSEDRLPVWQKTSLDGSEESVSTSLKNYENLTGYLARYGEAFGKILATDAQKICADQKPEIELKDPKVKQEDINAVETRFGSNTYRVNGKNTGAVIPDNPKGAPPLVETIQKGGGPVVPPAAPCEPLENKTVAPIRQSSMVLEGKFGDGRKVVQTPAQEQQFQKAA